MQKQLGRRVVELVGTHGLDDGQLISNAAEVRQLLRQFQPTLSMSLKLKPRAKQRRVSADECQLLAIEHVIRALLAIVPDQLWLEVEQLQMRRPTD